MEIKGFIIEIIYQNEINSYTIAIIQNEANEEITVVRIFTFCKYWRYNKSIW